MNSAINFFHLVFVAPLLVWFGLVAMKKVSMPRWMGTVLLTLAVIVVIFHGYKMYAGKDLYKMMMQTLESKK